MQAATVPTPVKNKTRLHSVTDVAISAARHKASAQFHGLSDSESADRISEAVQASPDGLVEIYDNTNMRRGWIATVLLGKFWNGVAVLTEDDSERMIGKRGTGNKLVITVLSKTAAHAAVEQLRWERPGGKPLAGLGDILPSLAAKDDGPLTQRLVIPPAVAAAVVRPTLHLVSKPGAKIIVAKPKRFVPASTVVPAGLAEQRVAFIEDILRVDPARKAQGPTGIYEAIKEKFGSGMSITRINKIREDFAAKPAAARQPSKPVLVVVPSESAEEIRVHAEVTRAVTPLEDLAAALVSALEEKRDAQAILATAQNVYDAAQADVAKILAQLQK